MYTLADGSKPEGPEGVFVQCHIAPGANMSYPADCLAANVPEGGTVTATVPRNELNPTKADVWCDHLARGRVRDRVRVRVRVRVS